MPRAQGFEVAVCFKDKLQNTSVIIETDNEELAKSLARKWAEKQNTSITRISIKQQVVFNLDNLEKETIDGVQIWPLPF